MTTLRRWWTDKYQLPWISKNIGDLTVFDLLVEFYEDVFEDDPQALLEAGRGEDGEIAFEDVDDPLIAKWEAEMAMGLEPDLTEGLGEKAKATLAKEKDKYQRARELSKKASSIDERFDDAIRRNPMYGSKTVETLGESSKSVNLSPDGVLGKGKR